MVPDTIQPVNPLPSAASSVGRIPPAGHRAQAGYRASGYGNDSRRKAAPAGHRLDILHATSAALIQALREVLLDSDFENAMKALTSWIPIKDEDLLMKVTKAEWKTRQSKKKT